MNCASCGEDFGRYHWMYLVWSKENGTYKCKRCLSPGRLPGGSVLHSHDGISGLELALGIFFAISWGIGPLAALVSDVYTYNNWGSLEISEIAGLSSGDYVKLRGVINASKEWKLMGEVNVYGNDPGFNDFILQDASGSIRVADSKNTCCFPGKNSLQDDDGDNYWFYMSGDNVWLVGRVARSPDGSKVLLMDAIAPGGMTIPPGEVANRAVAIVIIASLMAAPVVYYFRRSRLRRRKHEENCERYIHSGRPPGDMVMEAQRTVPNVWRKVDMALFLAVSVLIVLALMTLASFSLPTNGFGMLLAFSLLFLPVTVLPLFSFTARWAAPTEIGFSNEGVHFGYVNQRLALTLPVYVAWADVSEIRLTHHGSGKSSHNDWEMHLKEGETVSIDNLHRGLIDEMRSEFESLSNRSQVIGGGPSG